MLYIMYALLCRVTCRHELLRTPITFLTIFMLFPSISSIYAACFDRNACKLVLKQNCFVEYTVYFEKTNASQYS